MIHYTVYIHQNVPCFKGITDLHDSTCWGSTCSGVVGCFLCGRWDADLPAKTLHYGVGEHLLAKHWWSDGGQLQLWCHLASRAGSSWLKDYST